MATNPSLLSTQDLISVIIPVYNIAAFLPKCVDSILSQTWSRLEIILVDDGSTDTSGSICDAYARSDLRVTAYHKANGGLSSSRNYGLERAHGDWISFIDSDDWISPDFFSKLHEEAVCHNADISYCNWFFVYRDQTVPCSCFSPGTSPEETLSNLILESYHVVWNKLYRASFLEKFKLCFPNHIQQYEEDLWFSCRAFFFTEAVVKINQPLYFYNRENTQAITRSYDSEEARSIRYQVYCDLLVFYHEQGAGDVYDAPIYWRILQEKSWMVLQPESFYAFNETVPEANQHILDNPLLGWKMKILMWLVAHRGFFAARIALSLSRLGRTKV